MSLNKYGFLSFLWFALSWLENESSLTTGLVLFSAWVALGGHYTLYLMYHTLGRDLR